MSEEALQIVEKRREAKAKEKRKHIPIKMQSSKEWQGEIRKPSSVTSAKHEEINRMGKTSREISSRKLELPREHFMQRWAQ